MNMKTMKPWRIAFVMTAAMLSLASCSSDEKDGDWDTMVWKAEVPVVASMMSRLMAGRSRSPAETIPSLGSPMLTKTEKNFSLLICTILIMD